MNKIQLILASGSPRRAEILRQIGVNFKVVVSNEAENPVSKNPLEYPIENAKAKAISVSRKFMQDIVLGYDTLVFLDNEPLGKPHDSVDALNMLKRLNGHTHKVITGVAIAQNGKVLLSSSEETQVIFRNCKLQELKDYVNSNDPIDKAGAYGIQTAGARLVKEIRGCYYNVVGLPIACTLQMLNDLKVDV